MVLELGMVDMFKRVRPGEGSTVFPLAGLGMADISRRGRAEGLLGALSFEDVAMLDIFKREGAEGVVVTFLLDEFDELSGLPLMTFCIHRSTLCEAVSILGIAASGSGAIASILRNGTPLKISLA